MRLLLRADASAEIGMGHVMRCLALAQAWQAAGGEAVMAFAELPEALTQRLGREGLKPSRVHADPGSEDDARQTMEAVIEHRADWLVLDGYRFDLAYQHSLRTGPKKLLVVDDGASPREISADLIVNQNLFAEGSFYRLRDPQCELLLGPRYVLLRREFQEARCRRPSSPEEVIRLLVTVGGGQPPATLEALVEAALQSRIPDLELTLVVGPAGYGTPALDELARRPRVRLVHQPADMAELMLTAQMAVSSAGSTSWELACLGVPTLVLIVADNQSPVAAALDRAGIAVSLGTAEDLDTARLGAELESLAADQERRTAMAELGRRTIDGQGAHRVVRTMLAGRLRLRPAGHEDARLLWEWRNDPELRAAAFNSDPIPWQSHLAWFDRRLKDPDCRIFIVLDEPGRAVGQVRFERDGEAAEIHLSVAPELRGRGWGSRLIRRATEEFSRSEGASRVRAFVKTDNVASLRAFEAAGYESQGDERVKGHLAHRFLWRASP